MKKVGLPQRKPLPHFTAIERHNQAIIHFVTVCTQDRSPLLASDPAHLLLRDAWMEADSFIVGRYVIMPDHIHLFCSPAQPVPGYLQAWVRHWKSTVSKRWPMKKNGRLWQRDFWDTQLRRGESYENKWNYVRLNPVRHKLAKEANAWPYQGEVNCLAWHS
jgi:REP element-mobilizing transposase RayT